MEAETLGMPSWLALLLVMPAAYFAGSINFSIVLFHLLGRGDPRDRFSGNPGVTNVYRQAGLAMAALVLILDVGRAAVLALLARRLVPDSFVPWAAWALIMGNHFPCWHGFRGGKGVANYLGFCSVLLPLGTFASLGAYVAVFALVRIPFIASFGMLAMLTCFGIRRWWPDPVGLAGLLITAGSIVWFHRANIAGWLKARRAGSPPPK